MTWCTVQWSTARSSVRSSLSQCQHVIPQASPQRKEKRVTMPALKKQLSIQCLDSQNKIGTHRHSEPLDVRSQLDFQNLLYDLRHAPQGEHFEATDLYRGDALLHKANPALPKICCVLTGSRHGPQGQSSSTKPCILLHALKMIYFKRSGV